MGGGGINDDQFPDPNERPVWQQFIMLVGWLAILGVFIELVTR